MIVIVARRILNGDERPFVRGGGREAVYARGSCVRRLVRVEVGTMLSFSPDDEVSCSASHSFVLHQCAWLRAVIATDHHLSTAEQSCDYIATRLKRYDAEQAPFEKYLPIPFSAREVPCAYGEGMIDAGSMVPTSHVKTCQ